MNDYTKFKLIIFYLLIGIILTIMNSYHPIFVILLIEFLLYWFMFVLEDNKKTLKTIINC